MRKNPHAPPRILRCNRDTDSYSIPLLGLKPIPTNEMLSKHKAQKSTRDIENIDGWPQLGIDNHSFNNFPAELEPPFAIWAAIKKKFLDDGSWTKTSHYN